MSISGTEVDAEERSEATDEGEVTANPCSGDLGRGKKTQASDVLCFLVLGV